MGALGGRYSFPEVKTSEGTSLVYACRTVSVSAKAIGVIGPVSGEANQVVTLLLDHIGFVKGTVTRKLSGGFEVTVGGDQEDRQRLAAKVNWLKSHRLRKAREKRDAPRRYPRRPAAFIYLEDNSEHPCFLIDISASGAGVSAQLRPPAGTRLTIGELRAIVVRELETGFAVMFLEPPAPDQLETSLGARR